MADPRLTGDDEKRPPPVTRIAIWILVGSLGLYLVISGVIGILVKARS